VKNPRLVRLLAVVALLAPIAAILFGVLSLGQTAERVFYDRWFNRRGPLPKPDDIVIVKIDNDSEQSLGRYPWSRLNHVKLIENLKLAGAKVVAFDATFADEFPATDTILRKAIDDAGNVIIGAKTALVTNQGAVGNNLEPPVGILNGAPIGGVDAVLDADGIMREYPVLNDYPTGRVEQLGVKAVMQYLGLPDSALRVSGAGWDLADKHIPRGPNGGMLINFIGPPNSVSAYSYAYVVDDSTNFIGDWDMDEFETLMSEGRFKDKIVFVGSMIPEDQDLYPTSFRQSQADSSGVSSETANRTFGVEVHAHAAKTLLEGNFIKEVPRNLQYLWTALLALILVVAVPKLRFLTGALVAVVLAGVSLYASWYMFSKHGMWLWAATPLVSTGLAYAGTSGVLFFTEEQEKARIRGMFSQYVASSVVDQLIEKPELMALGGAERVCSVLFTDVVGFSGVSEKITPTQLVALLNEYLTEMTEIVVEEGGIVDKYVGDLIMAEFGVPIPMDNHAEACCRASLRMRQRLAELRDKWKSEGKPELEARIGINTGIMLVGNLGSKRIMDYTVMGDNVNLASRLEGTNKEYGTVVMVSEATYAEIKDKFVCRELDSLRVKGRAKGVAVYELIETNETGVPQERRELNEAYAGALALYRAQRFQEAKAAFSAIYERHHDYASKMFAKRCEEYIASPPPADWDGVYTMTTK
jgi:adenylate cyclase